MGQNESMRLLACLAMANALCATQSVMQLFEEAATALTKGDYVAAERGFLKVLSASPDHVDTLVNLGVVYARTDRLEQAIITYRRAGELRPDDPSVLLNLGLAYLKQQSYGDALAVFQRLVEVDPGTRFARDAGLLHRLVAGYLKQRPLEEVRSTLDAFLAKLPLASASLVLCRLYSENERFEEAAAQCRQTLAIDPLFPGVHLTLARVLLSQGSPEAEQELSTAIREGPTDAEALYDVGVALLQVGRVAEAVVYLERSTRLDQDFWASYFQLGKAKLQLDQAKEAIPLLRRATELKPDSFSAFYVLGRALMDAGRVDEARRAMHRVRELTEQKLAQDNKELQNQLK
jgi:tetratricopeptide (TPR) repeat protein